MGGPGRSYRPTQLGARPSLSELVFPHKRALLQTEILLSSISCPVGWCHTIPQVKKTNLDVLGWRGYTWSAVEAGWTYCQILYNYVGGINIEKQLWLTFLQSACQLHVPSKLATSVVL